MRLAAEGSTRVGEAVGAIRKMSETVIGASERIRALESGSARCRRSPT
jgi:methyl-accepting chemotaxis protein